MGEAGKGFLIYAAFCFRAFDMAINAHARAEYAIDYTIEYMSQREAFGKKISKFQALRHTGRACHRGRTLQSFNYAAVARLDKNT
jgi:alkylation response protein AidB-like acyl-CoA dehydrogenase